MLFVTDVQDASLKGPLPLPLFGSRVPAGFPSPADDYIETSIDLTEHMVQHPAATFFLRVEGDSMKDAGIDPSDLLVVDRSLEPRHESIVIACLNGELTVKRLWRMNGRLLLMPESDAYVPIEISEDADLVIWGVVTFCVKDLRR